MYLIPSAKQNAPIISSDVLHIANHAEISIKYAFAYLISQDTSLVQTIISNHSIIEDKCNVLLEAYREDHPYFELDMESNTEALERNEDPSAIVNIQLLQYILTLNNATIAIIKLVALSYSSYDAHGNALRDISQHLSTMFKGAIDAYIQQDAQIALKGKKVHAQLNAILSTLAKDMDTPTPDPFIIIKQNIENIQNLIIKSYSTS